MAIRVPELGEWTGAPPIRLPIVGNVPSTPRLRALLDTATVQRLRGVRQLGLAQLVYPGAVHTRFEHSLGTYDHARRLAANLLREEGAAWLSEDEVKVFLCASLLHDVGHYPFSHTLEDLPPDTTGRIAFIKHDQRARELILNDPDLVKALEEEWQVAPERVAAVIDEANPPADLGGQRLVELLSGPLNPDRLDYLQRDSNHVGVPYGRVIDLDRLLVSLCVQADGTAVGVSSKGVSAVETLIFASYMMYREVYWHHTVRAAQAMLKRAVTEAVEAGELQQQELVDLDDEQAIARLRRCGNEATRDLVERLTGPGRALYRRVFSASGLAIEEGRFPAGADIDFLRRSAQLDYWAQQALCAEACQLLSRRLGRPVPPHALLVDRAGRGKELFFTVPVCGGDGRWVGTTADSDISLVAPNLSRNFDQQAKRVQILAAPEYVEAFRDLLGVGN